MTLLTRSWAVTEYELGGYLFLVGGLILRSLNQSFPYELPVHTLKHMV